MTGYVFLWGAFDYVALTIVLQFLKINQYCLTAVFFYAFIARVAGRASLLPRYTRLVNGIDCVNC